MAVDITNHLIPYTQVKQMLANAWDQGYEAGIDDARAFDAVNENWFEYDEYEDTPNPYREEDA